MLIFWGVVAIGFLALFFGLIWAIGNPTKAIIGGTLLLSGISIANSLGINPLSVPLVLLVGYLAAPLVRGFIEGKAGNDAGADRHKPGEPA